MITVPALIEDALWAAARRRLDPALLGGPALTAAVVDRSRRYTSERERLATPAPGRAASDLAARALFFSIADAGKPALVLAELADRRAPAGFLDGDLAVLDLGAGCGAMTLGLLAFLAARGYQGAIDVTALDHDAGALAIAADAIAAVAAGLGLRVAVTTRVGDVLAPPPRTGFDLVLAGSVLNELPEPRAAAERVVAALGPRGVAIVVEPALRVTTRALHAVRDGLIADGRIAVLAPCTRRAAPCPALADERDWCHDHRPVTLPPRTRQLAHVTGLRDGELKLAFLAFTHPAAAPPPPAAWRVVDDPHTTKGKLELTGCGAAGWVPVRRLRRHRSATNRALERAHRGDLLAIDRAIPEGAAAIEVDQGDSITLDKPGTA